MKDYKQAYNELLEANKELQKNYTNLVARLDDVSDALSTEVQIREQSPRSMSIINLDREIIWINKRAEKIFGYQLEEVKGKRISDLLFGPLTDFSMIPQALDNAKNGLKSQYEHIVYKRDRTPIWVAAEMSPLYNKKKEIDRILVLSLDISEQKKLINKTIEAEKRHKLLLDYSPDIIYQIDLNGKIIDVNQAWTKILGYSKEETLAQQGNLFFHPADVELAKGARQTLLNGTAMSYNIDVRVMAKNGDVVWLNTTSIPLHDSLGEVIGFNGISKDITKQKREQAYRELIAEHVRSMIYITDKNRYYVFVSPSFKALTGWTPEELIGKYAFDFHHPDDILRLNEYRDANIRGEIKDDESIQIRYLKKDGSYIWIEVYAKWVYDKHDNTNKTIITGFLIDKKRKEDEKIQAQLEEEKKLNRLKTSFLQFVSHEFKTPLSVIRALCDVIKMDIESGTVDISQLTADVNNIDKEIDGLVELIEDVLVLEQLESGNINLRFKGQSVLTLIADVNDRLSIRNKNGGKATINVVGTPKSVPGDSKYLALIFRNLLSNAYKYSEGCPSPVVTINYFDNQCVVSVKDFGIGIPEGEQKSLFDNFYRASNVSKIDGTGLGLSLVKKFVGMHGGNIVCVSKENEGTEMLVSLPVVMEDV